MPKRVALYNYRNYNITTSVLIFNYSVIFIGPYLTSSAQRKYLAVCRAINSWRYAEHFLLAHLLTRFQNDVLHSVILHILFNQLNTEK